jgi:nitric oxide synthase oxygenase domain/subunit
MLECTQELQIKTQENKSLRKKELINDLNVLKSFKYKGINIIQKTQRQDHLI